MFSQTNSHTNFSPRVLHGALLTGLFSASIALACSGEYRQTSLVQQSHSNDPLSSAESIRVLRAEGQSGVDVLCAEHDRLVKAGAQPEQLKDFRATIDAVARQRDAYASRLFWHTDFAETVNAAEAAGKPILTLRLLGNLDEDLSCANSRFFRSVLYANAEVSQYLRDHYVLHWQSLRPVPRMTIDMGDGRQIRRTITGNSVHYVMSAQGELIDAIPGLQSPKSFLANLKSAEIAAKNAAATADLTRRITELRQFHMDSMAKIDDAWRHDRDRVAGRAAVPPGDAGLANAAPAALVAAPLARTKSREELPALRAMFVNSAAPPATLSEEDERMWDRIAALHFTEASLDQASVALMREKSGIQQADDAGKLSMTKRMVEDPFMTMMRSFQRSLAADTVRNEYVIHRQIHQWLTAEDPRTNIDTFNRRVYAQLFLSPLNDPWLGLALADVYSGLDQNGLAMSCN